MAHLYQSFKKRIKEIDLETDTIRIELGRTTLWQRVKGLFVKEQIERPTVNGVEIPETDLSKVRFNRMFLDDGRSFTLKNGEWVEDKQ